MSISKLVVDLNARTFSIEVPDEKLDAVLDRLEEMFSSKSGRLAPTPHKAEPENAEQPAIPSGKIGRKRGRTSGVGKTKSWTIVDLGLDEEQRTKLRQHFSDKAPKGQGEEVAVLSAKLAEMTGQKLFNGDHIHSALKIVDRPTPKNMTAVFGNMKRDGLGDYKGNDFIVNHYTEDHVKFKLPRAEKAKK